MPMSKEQFEAAIAKLDNKDEILEFFTSSVDAEKNKAIEDHRVKNKENQQLKENLKGLKSLLAEIGWDETGDSKAFIETLKQTVAGKEELEAGANKEVQALRKSLEKIQNDLKAEQDQRVALQRQNKIKTLENTLTSKMQDLIGHNFIIKSMIADGAVDVDDNGEVVFKEGDDVIKLDDGLKKFVAKHPELKKNSQVAGSGSRPNGSGNTKVKYTKEQLDSMTQEQAAADITNYNESFKAHYSN